MSTKNANVKAAVEAIKSQTLEDKIIILKSVYGKVGMKYFIQPCKDMYGRYPDCVKRVTSSGDLILTDAERNSSQFFIGENETFIIQDGDRFDLSIPEQAAKWEAIKNCNYIVEDRYAKDSQGNLLIDGTLGYKTRNPRYGKAELYIFRPGNESRLRVDKRKLKNQAENYIIEDSSEHRLLVASVLGKKMDSMPDADVEDFLLQIAEKDPSKIIECYTSGTNMKLRLLLIAAKNKYIITVKDKIYYYKDTVLGATDDAAVSWMKKPENKSVLNLITQEVYPDEFEQ